LRGSVSLAFRSNSAELLQVVGGCVADAMAGNDVVLDRLALNQTMEAGRSTALIWTKASLLPSSSEMKPCPWWR
jgi:hypothetical protein